MNDMGILDIFKTEPKPIEETVKQQQEEQEAHEITVMRHRKRPQDDVPQEVITHYIVKDYQRMFNETEHLRLLGQQAAREVRKVLAVSETTKAEIEVYKKKNRELKEENLKLKNEVNKLSQKVNDAGNDAIKTLARIKQIIEARDYLKE